MTTDAREAGREMDAAVHRALGHDLPCTHASVTLLGGTLMRCDGCGNEYGQTTLAMARSWPHYSTDVEAAFGAAASLMERGFEFEINARTGYVLVRVWFTDYDGGRHCEAEEEADYYSPEALAAAISRAALLTLDSESRNGD